MPNGTSLSLNEHARDAALILNMADIRTTQTVLLAVYAKIFDLTPEAADKHLREMRQAELEKVWGLLAQFGHLDVPGLRESLGL